MSCGAWKVPAGDVVELLVTDLRMAASAMGVASITVLAQRLAYTELNLTLEHNTEHIPTVPQCLSQFQSAARPLAIYSSLP